MFYLILMEKKRLLVIDGTISSRNDYDVLIGLERLLDPLRNDNAPRLRTYLVTVSGYKDETEKIKYLIGKIGIALSFGDIDKQEALLFIQMNRDKKVSAIDIVQDNNCIVEEIDFDTKICKTDRRFVTVKTTGTEDEWLEIYWNRINGSKISDDLSIYYGIDINCVMEVDNGHYIKKLQGREEIWATLEVIFNLGFSNASVVNKKILYESNSSISIEVNDAGNIAKMFLYTTE